MSNDSHNNIWNFDKTINIPTLIAFLSMMVLIFGWKADIEKNISHNIKDIEYLKVEIKRDRSFNEKEQQDIHQQLIKIEALLYPSYKTG